MMRLSPIKYGVKTVILPSGTVSLLNFNGADNSAVFTDETGKIWTGFGGAVLDNNVAPKYGSAYLALNGATSYISTPHSADLNLSGTDFTIECWFLYNGFFQTQFICSKDAIASKIQYGVRVTNTNKISGIIGDAGVAFSRQEISGSTNVPGGWNHVAFVKDSGFIKIYLNGLLEASSAIAITMTDSGNPLVIGTEETSGTNYYNGGIDDFRISNYAVYTANFTPPTAELTYP